MLIEYENVFNGENIKIFATRFNGKCPYTDFLDNLSENEKGKLHKKISNNFCLFDLNKGRLFNPEKCKPLKFSCSGCEELKINQLRISFIREKSNIFLLDIFKKKSNKWPKHMKQKTEQLCNKVQEHIEGGNYEF